MESSATYPIRNKHAMSSGNPIAMYRPEPNGDIYISKDNAMKLRALCTALYLVTGFFALAHAELPEYALTVGNLNYSVRSLVLDTSAHSCLPFGINDGGTVVGY